MNIFFYFSQQIVTIYISYICITLLVFLQPADILFCFLEKNIPTFKSKLHTYAEVHFSVLSYMYMLPWNFVHILEKNR